MHDTTNVFRLWQRNLWKFEFVSVSICKKCNLKIEQKFHLHSELFSLVVCFFGFFNALLTPSTF